MTSKKKTILSALPDGLVDDSSIPFLKDGCNVTSLDKLHLACNFIRYNKHKNTHNKYVDE